MVTVENSAISLEEQIYLQIEEDILSGKLGRGEQLREQALCSVYGASRTPIRGALHRLAEAGLVEISANRGATVVGIDKDTLVDTYKIRMRLEGLASQMASLKMTEKEKTELSECVELSEFYLHKKDAEKLREQDTLFHKIIYEASGSKLLCKILTDLHRKVKLYRKISLSNPERIENSIKEHREILNAILSGNADLSEKLTFLHVENALKSMIEKED